MGNSNTKKVQKVPDKFFERERWKETKRAENIKKKLNTSNKRAGMKDLGTGLGVPGVTPPGVPPGAGPAPAAARARSYHEEALDRMRYQLINDSDAFLLNNILLSVQFFENYEREVQHIKDNPINEREHAIDEAMVQHHKHVFFADRLSECVHEHVRILGRQGHLEPLSPQRLFIIYDNIEASEPGDTSDYSAVLDTPFYKLRVEECREPGYVQLKKLEVLESVLQSKQTDIAYKQNDSDDSIYHDSENESTDSDDPLFISKGEALLQKLKSRLNEQHIDTPIIHQNVKNLNNNVDLSGRRASGPVRQTSKQAQKGNISNISKISKVSVVLTEENDDIYQSEAKPRKSILKISNTKFIKDNKGKAQFEINESAENLMADDTDTSGYRSNTSSRQNESETESEYGYSTITESATPKPVELSLKSNYSVSSGVLPDQCWNEVKVKSVDESDDEEDNDDASGELVSGLSRNLYDTFFYLSSTGFMVNFVDNFMMKLASGLGITQNSIDNALTQGASIYCEYLNKNVKSSYEIIPAFIAAWPNAANQWIIRERRIIQNPRTNVSYQWPTKYMVSKGVGFGCLLVPIGFRPKRGVNVEQKNQWKIIFPAAERYLESCLAHSQIRCYLFALALQKTFIENESSKIGLDSSHLKNHLFWQCEADYSKWPEDRLGETLRLFLKSFYLHFVQAKFPNYFIEHANEFKSVPKPLLLKLQRKLADILEAPVMHVLSAVEKLKYMRKDFYPKFNIQRLYYILTCKNPLRILYPHLPIAVENISSEDEQESSSNFWDTARKKDKHYQWKKEKHRQMQEKRKADLQVKKQKNSRKTVPGKHEMKINLNIILPKKMDADRRRLVLEFFIPHFIAMARSSEKFEAIRQALIYLEHAHKLCDLLLEEPAGEITAREYLDVIRDKLDDCRRKLVNQVGFNLPQRKETNINRSHLQIQKKRPKYSNIINHDSPTEVGKPAFTFADIHTEKTTSETLKSNTLKLSNVYLSESDEESKL